MVVLGDEILKVGRFFFFDTPPTERQGLCLLPLNLVDAVTAQPKKKDDASVALLLYSSVPKRLAACTFCLYSYLEHSGDHVGMKATMPWGEAQDELSANNQHQVPKHRKQSLESGPSAPHGPPGDPTWSGDELSL